MRGVRKNKSGFTLAEMIMAVAMLAFFSIFIVQLFAKAEQLSRQSETLDQAVLAAADLADQWKGDSQDIEPEVLALRQNFATDSQATLYFDEHFKRCAPQEASFIVTLTFEAREREDSVAPAFGTLMIAIWPADESNEEIFSLRTARVFLAEESS